MVGAGPTVLVADDEDGIRDLYELWLGDEYEILLASDGREALDHLSRTVDVVLLDREMPGPSGMDVAESIDRSDHDPGVVVVSSKPQDIEVASRPIDEYLRKPVDASQLRDAIERHHSYCEYEAILDELFALAADLAALETDRSRDELADDQEYVRLRDRIEEKRGEAEAALDRCDGDWRATFETFPGCTATGAGEPTA